MAFFHPEDVVKAKLSPTAADNKGIGVGEKENRENTEDDDAQNHRHLDIDSAAHLRNHRVVGQKVHDVEHRCKPDTAKTVREIEAAVGRDILHGHLQVKLQSAHPYSSPSFPMLCSERAEEVTIVRVSEMRVNISLLESPPR